MMLKLKANVTDRVLITPADIHLAVAELPGRIPSKIYAEQGSLDENKIQIRKITISTTIQSLRHCRVL